MDIRWFWRMKRWVQNPPSRRTIWIVCVVLAICLGLWLLEYSGVLPDDMRPQSMKLPPIR